ncbi:MAG TPA: elongation factor P-like protein YeiP [Pseudomonas sabulinigri]|uniref:Elongation factor P-like protein n=1 Tax=marine sediment metagenome TaxID=412755 RepID=A0A0F9WQK0_9ZZZZ|nr:elongation factor P-like protein YeiP [Halopseudomonas sabulinigri]HEC52348.1 elongation factor P-like protein YeiP [Halopseudomonas sabulinigri]|tara:strand:- start:1979 stop:2545 length:567 start_codon:yes stop_codon:yes gene_type:complete
MPRAAELKKGHIVQINNQPYIVSHIEVKSPSSRSGTTLYKVRFNHVQTKQKLDQSLTGDDMLSPIDFQKRQMQFLFQDADGYTFMDNEDFAQFTLNPDQLESEIDYIFDGIEGLYGLVVEGNLVGIELPAVVEMAIEETPPAIKGSSASARTKTARFATGLEIQIPEYLETGEVVRINTESGKFMSRA